MLNLLKMIQPVLDNILSCCGQPYIVGGAVRDHLMGNPASDLDIEVHGMDMHMLYSILIWYGNAEPVGKSFGVIKLWIDGKDYDFSLPRRDSKLQDQVGHKAFKITFDEDIGMSEAAERRDFTVNALMYDPFTNIIYDFFDGTGDIKRGWLSEVKSHTFREDPLRGLRAIRFAAQLDFMISPVTVSLCQEMVEEAKSLPVERFWGEIEKWCLKSKKPSRFLDELVKTEWITLFPELLNLTSIPQELRWHPEGGVWEHTKQVVDFAKHICDRENLNDTDRKVLMLAALCHDIGKATTTEIIDGHIRSPNHSSAGKPLTESLLTKFGVPLEIIKRVVVLVQEHMVRWDKKAGPSKRLVIRLAKRLAEGNETIPMIIYTSEADASGRYPDPPVSPLAPIIPYLDSINLTPANVIPNNLLLGRHLIKLGLKPGPIFGEIINFMYDLQLDDKIQTTEDAIKIAKLVLCIP